MWWEIRGKRAGKQGRWMIETISEIGAQTRAKWSGIDVSVVLTLVEPPARLELTEDEVIQMIEEITSGTPEPASGGASREHAPTR